MLRGTLRGNGVPPTEEPSFCRRRRGACVEAPQLRKTVVLSVQLPSIGHKVFGGLLRRSFAESEALDFHAYWTDEEREPWARVINQLLRSRLPIPWVMKRNLDLRRVRGELGYAFYARRLVQRMRHRFRVDVLHFHTQTAALLSTDLIRQIPTVITCDQTTMQAAPEWGAAWQWTHVPGFAVERFPFRAAAAVVPFSRWAAESVINGHGVDPRRVHVIPIGVVTSDFADIDRGRRFDGEARPMRLLFVGGDFRRKGGPLLVDVFLERFADRGVELHLVTPAPGIIKHPQIFVYPQVTAFSAEWKRLYAQADVFVLPTRWEAFGIVFVEAMAAGLPIVATSIGAIPEIVAENETGLLIERDAGRELGERIETLLDNASLRRRLGENGPPRVAALFEASKNAAKLAQVFGAVARRGGSERSPALT
jgi:glycosyltransferase involved in cell wall biosynthesis